MHSPNFIVFIVLSTFVACAVGLKCYHCNSNENGGCKDPFDPEAAKEFLIDCQEKMPNSSNINYNYCRKTIQKTALKGMREEDKRYIRTCGHIPDTRVAKEEGDDPMVLKCYRRAGTFDVEMNYCVCYADECNPAGRIETNLANLVGLLALGGLVVKMTLSNMS